jgi:hypothetical protein
LIFGLPPLLDLLPESDAVAWRRHMEAMRALEIRVPERLYLSPVAPDKRREPLRPPRPTEEPKPAEVAKSQPGAPAPGAPRPRVTPRAFTPPEGVHRTNEDLTLVQSHLPPELALARQVKLPQLALMSGPVLPRPAPRQFVEPGRSADPAVVPRVDAPPPLAPASDANPELKISSMIAGPESAKLRLPRPNVPARKFQAPAPLPSGRGASLSPTVGEPVYILAYSSDPAPLTERVIVPLGNQIGRLPSLPAFGEPGDASSGPGGTGQSAAGRGTGSGAGAGGTGSGGTVAGGTGNGGTGGGASAGAGRQADLAEFARALASLPERYATPIKIVHPSNGVFDVVVMQSSADGALPDSAGALSGKPVYTVYLQVGAPKAWILQYCIPKQAPGGPQVSGSVVNIGAPSPVKAPYPLVSVLPPATMLPRTSYIIIHALLDEKGQIQDAVMLRSPSPKLKDLILPDLSRWQFRPAVRDGAPVAVEILLAIPPQDV